MTQFKDKSQQSSTASEGFISAGLFDYPVLQTADILLYKADLVPVGKDQDQHLELTRDIAQRFNQQLGKEYFALPEATYTEAPKILSTADPSRKMSKSAGEKHFISLFETEKRIEKQIKSAVTDTGEVSDTMSPGVENLFTLLRMAGGHEAHESLMQDHASGSLKYVDLKQATSDALIDFNKPIIEKRSELMADRKKVKDQIKQSSYEIRKVAQETIKEVKQLAGLPNVRFT
jgi:tryptophanyl-tRNA synthetase